MIGYDESRNVGDGRTSPEPGRAPKGTQALMVRKPGRDAGMMAPAACPPSSRRFRAAVAEASRNRTVAAMEAAKADDASPIVRAIAEAVIRHAKAA